MIFTDPKFRFVFAFKLYNENQNQNLIINIKERKPKPKLTKTDRVDHHAIPEDSMADVSIRQSAALLTMLAQVNFLILHPLIALNHKLYFFSKSLLILLYGNRVNRLDQKACADWRY